MRFRFTSTLVLVTAAGALAAAQAPARPSALTVHEWGTFTSIAGDDGGAVSWLPQGGQSDLPCFVEHGSYNVKGSMRGTVRMETPVLYFYAPRDVTVNVGVGFRQGVITEWFPHASVGTRSNTSDGTISWSDVKVSPGLTPAFPVEAGASHYYKARHTDASPLSSGAQTEKFLFYRGVGQFAPPISAAVRPDGRVDVWTPRGTPIGDVILFENRRGATAYDVRHVAAGRVTLDRPAVDDAKSTPQRELVRILVASGLFRKEAEAMVDTWSDSWFEEGARLLYIAPRQDVDAIVPLAIDPAPASVARVFVGRMELMTPATMRAVRLALTTNDRATLEKYGRFLQPIGDRVMKDVSAFDQAFLGERLRTVTSSWSTPTSSCR